MKCAEYRRHEGRVRQPPILVKTPYLIRGEGCRFFDRSGASPKLRITHRLVTILAVAAAACGGSPTEPSGPPQAGTEINLTAVGASDVIGIGSSVVCPPFTDCANGTGYVFVAARALRDRGFTVNVSNLGIPTGVISRGFQDLSAQLNRFTAGNFIDQASPLVRRETTLLTVFTGANEVNIITGALGQGAGAGDPDGYVDQQLHAFGNDVTRLMGRLREQAPNARIIVLNVPNLAGLPFSSRAALPQRQAAQRASVGMTSTVLNPLSSTNVFVIDLMCDERLYDRASYSADGFHPGDAGYAVIGNAVAVAATSASYATPRASCAQMSLVP
jgi:lysophospholipase L1-like esterase